MSNYHILTQKKKEHASSRLRISNLITCLKKGKKIDN